MEIRRTVTFLPIDGVLVDVISGLNLVLTHYLRLSPFIAWPAVKPPHTIRRLCRAAGLTEGQIHVVRRLIRSSKDWYLKLDPMSGAAELLPDIRDECRTGRMALYVRRIPTAGRSTEEQVKLWLKRHAKISNAMLFIKKEE